MSKSDYLEKSKAYKGFHYSVLDPKELEYLHKRTLEMFLQVKEIFERNNIKYMICGGTLLGAIGGGNGHVIPWDDDFDVCIFEEDYERAIECLTDPQTGLKDDTVLQCKKTDPNYYLGWMKVRDQRSHVYPDAPKFKENGVWIDLYKLVKTERRKVPYLIAKEALDYVNRRYEVGGLTKEEYDSRVINGDLVAKIEAAKRECENSTDEIKVCIIWSASKVVLDEEWILPLRSVGFEGTEMTTFNGAEEYLRQHYGDKYNELPEDELRRVGINKVEVK